MESCRGCENPDASYASESESDNREPTMVDPLLASISVIVKMMIERQPPPAKFLAASIEKFYQAAVRVKDWVRKKLRQCSGELNGLGVPISHNSR